ncbi:hypothetical protein VZT92_007456 [Zoarces viviparus]|uniref:Uncharacterized protein n=1 Tax=Zoarces viviparus TaxID=48416 RepID=A0AAW1FLG3_ZOAVI
MFIVWGHQELWLSCSDTHTVLLLDWLMRARRSTLSGGSDRLYTYAAVYSEAALVMLTDTYVTSPAGG